MTHQDRADNIYCNFIVYFSLCNVYGSVYPWWHTKYTRPVFIAEQVSSSFLLKILLASGLLPKVLMGENNKIRFSMALYWRMQYALLRNMGPDEYSEIIEFEIAVISCLTSAPDWENSSKVNKK